MVEDDKPSSQGVLPQQDLYEMEVIGSRLFRVAVHADADPEFKAYILAAGTAHSMRMRSIDNVLRKHGDSWCEKFENGQSAPEVAMTRLRAEIANKAIKRCDEISKLDLKHVPVEGLIAAANAQIRLESTFRAALHLIWLGYAFESEAVIRLALEQTAWTYAIRGLWTKEDVLATSGTGWITKLKEVFPGAGRTYSRLSNLAHVAPMTHSRFMGQTESEVFVRIRCTSHNKI